MPTLYTGVLVSESTYVYAHVCRCEYIPMSICVRTWCGSDDKASVYNVGDRGLIPGSGRSPGEGNGNPLQYYCLENPLDRGAWQATVHGVAKSQTRLSDFNQINPHKALSKTQPGIQQIFNKYYLQPSFPPNLSHRPNSFGQSLGKYFLKKAWPQSSEANGVDAFLPTLMKVKNGDQRLLFEQPLGFLNIFRLHEMQKLQKRGKQSLENTEKPFNWINCYLIYPDGLTSSLSASFCHLQVISLFMKDIFKLLAHFLNWLSDFSYILVSIFT